MVCLDVASGPFRDRVGLSVGAEFFFWLINGQYRLYAHMCQARFHGGL